VTREDSLIGEFSLLVPEPRQRGIGGGSPLQSSTTPSFEPHGVRNNVQKQSPHSLNGFAVRILRSFPDRPGFRDLCYSWYESLIA
jgi:hypothetical protein